MDDRDQSPNSDTFSTSSLDEVPVQCVDLSEVARTVYSASKQPETADELCEVCCKIDLNKFFGTLCNDQRPHHYHLGNVEDVQVRKSCALCRLISAVHDSASLYMSDVSIETPLLCTLVSTFNSNHIKIYFNVGTSKWDVENKGAVHVIRKCIEDSIALGNLSSAPTKLNEGLHGRLMNSRQVDFDLIRKWLQLCETLHGDVCGRSKWISRRACKIRLIDVLNRQIVDSATNERYLALSYVWGPGHQFCLNKQNQGDLRVFHGLKDDNMPKTIKDAFDVVAKIGERYLWVDRLCILMDDERDKLEQMSNMDQIYSSAVLTIVAASEYCANACIPGVEPNTRKLLQHSEVIHGIRYVTTPSDLVPAVLMLNWSTRGWTYQEGFLSLRCLVLTPYQTYFQCKSEVWCEDSCWVGSKHIERRPPIGNALCHLRDYQHVNTTCAFYWVDKSRCDFYQYADSVEGFSRRQLTVETDALWAFTGITKAFQPQFQSGFVWGVPVEKLDAALLWKPLRYLDCPRKGLHAAIVDDYTIRLPFPTWSWVSWRGGVKYDSKCEQAVRGLVEWHQPARWAVNTAEPFSKPWCQAANYETLNSTQKDRPIQPPNAILDEQALGFLRFTAASAKFDIELLDLVDFHKDRPEGCMACREWVLCWIRARTGKNVGYIRVPISWLKTHSQMQGEFILLSMHIEDAESETCQKVFVTDPTYPDVQTSDGIKHVDNCEHQSTYNVMLIDWKEGPHCSVAIRINTTRIHKNNWIESEANSKLIVLS